MSDTPKPAGPPRMEVEVVSTPTVTSDPSQGGTHESSPDATSVSFDGGLGPEEDDLEGQQDAGTEGEGAEPPRDETEAEPDADALPDYDPDNEGVRAAYDKKFFTEAGTVNLPALSGEFFANAAKDKDGKGGLNEGTYAYLQDTLGLDKAAVQEIERGQMALREQANTAFYGKIEGGKERYEKAIAWAVGGGYSEAQRAAYNEAQTKGGAAFEDAVDALMSRFGRASGDTGKPQRRGPPTRRPSSPQRDVTAGSRAGGGDGPAMSQAEYGKQWGAALAAVSEARKTGDRAKIREAETQRDELRRKARRGGVKL
ncbi:hypothetical protein [uncultured Methylobacterium sp.]|jgi:hypothetical protein|uniref:hypothetical protein n=1 Tax=uncultured Methylobacterium sp. TaxID=157278 RepID=UPI00261C3496|nr:hypothetical protein [uncultured Methylobacterium sp.]